MNDYKQIRASLRLDRQNVASILESCGIKITRDFRFKDNISFSIAQNGLIKDFGSTGFCGDVISYMYEKLNMKLPEALNIASRNSNLSVNYAPAVKQESKPAIDLNSYAKKLQDCFLHKLQFEPTLIRGKLCELFEVCMANIALHEYFGYSLKYNSLAIILRDSNAVVKTIAIRKAGDIKWKSYGTKSFIVIKKSKNSNLVFIVSGMAEIVLLDSFGFSFVGLQSDSIALNIKHSKQANAVEDLCIDKCVCFLLDNDESCKKASYALRQFFAKSIYIELGFEDMLGRKLPKGYDLRDYCNDLAQQGYGVEYIKTTLLRQIGDKLTKLKDIR